MSFGTLGTGVCEVCDKVAVDVGTVLSSGVVSVRRGVWTLGTFGTGSLGVSIAN